MHPRFFLLALLALTLAACNPISEKNIPKVTATGIASIDIKPDIAMIGFEVLVFNKDAAAATKDLSLTSLTLVTFLNAQTIDEKDVEARQIEKNTVRSTNDRGQHLEILGYEITRSYSIKLRDLTKFESIMRDLYAMPNVSQLSTSFEAKDKEKHEAELLQKACTKAKEQAEQLAKGFGVRLGKIQAISMSSPGDAFGYMNLKGSLNVDQADVRVNQPLFYPPASIKLSQEVNAVYELNN